MKRLIYSCIIFTFSVSYSLAALVGHWSFDDHFKDSSENGYHGTVQGKPLQFIEGKQGRAVEFNGASSVGCGNVPLGDTGELTVAFWAKPTKPERSWGGIVQKQNRDYLERSFWIGAHRHGIMWAYFSPSIAKGRPLRALNTITSGEWVHVAMTFDGAYQKTYINGELFVTSEKMDAPFVDGGDIFRFGRVENTKGGHYWGGLDDVWVFSDALSEEDIAKIMAGEGITKSVELKVVEAAPTSIAASQLPVTSGLLIDLNAKLDVEVEDGNRVAAWRNQVKGGRADVFVKRDEGRKVPGSGRPTLLKNVDAIGGHSALLFNRQELVNMEEDSCDHLLLGSGYTWVSVMSIHDQAGGAKDVNAFFGNLRNSAPYDGIMGSLYDDNRIWAHSRSTDITKEKGKRYPKWKEKVRPQLDSPEPIEEDRYYIIMGRMGAGKDTVDLDLFINSADAMATKPYTVTLDSDCSKLAIGQERDATTHPGGESFHGEIARFLIYERSLTDAELSQVIDYFVQYYQIQIVD